MQISPTPTDEEAAAIVVAIEATLARAVVGPTEVAVSPRWRFAGRWWSKPIPSRRARPW